MRLGSTSYEGWVSDEALTAFRTSGGEQVGDGPRTPAILGADVAK